MLPGQHNGGVGDSVAAAAAGCCAALCYCPGRDQNTPQPPRARKAL